MPDPLAERLEWNEQNLSEVISSLYREAETNAALHAQLMADPFEVLNGRIVVPEEFRGGIFARQKHQQAMVLYVPAFGTVREELPEGTTSVEQPGDYEIICTTGTDW